MNLTAVALNAYRNVVRQVHRSAAALLAVAFGTTAMILAAGFIDSNLRFGRDNTIQSQLGHLQVMRPGFLERGRSDPRAYLLPAAAAELRRLDTLPGLKVVAPRLMISGLASSGETTLSFIGEGVDPAAELVMSSALRFPAGRNLAAGESNTAIVGQGLARNLDLTVGDDLVLIANTETGGISAVEARVVGVFESITKAYDDVALRIPIALARTLMRVDGEHVRLVLLERTDDTAASVERVRAALPAQHYQVVPWMDLADFYKKTAALFERQVRVIHVIIAVIIVLAISNTMTMSVIQRISEIGTMMALGNRRRDIVALFIVEGITLGVIGTLAGLVLGVVLAVLISLIGIPMPPGPGMSWSYRAGIALSAQNLVTAGLVALLTTAFASLFPAWKASRLAIVDALRTRQ